MAKQNKVAVNLAQDFTDAEKAQARTNIGASQISYGGTVTDMAITKEKYTATVGEDSFLLLPSTFSDGMVVKSNGSLQTQTLPKEVPTGGQNGQVLTWNNGTYDWANAASELPPHSSTDAGKALILDSHGNPIWSDIDASPAISRLSEYSVQTSPSTIGTSYGSEKKRELHSFTKGTYPNTISAWIQEKDYKYGILHYTMALELWNSDTAAKWCVIDQGHIQNTDFHIIGKCLYIPFAPGHTYVPIDHTVVFLKSDVGNIMSTVMVVMGLQSWPAGDPNFHADDKFQVVTIHTDLTLFNW